MAVAVARRDLSAVELRREAARSRDAKAARRMPAIALVLEGRPRAEAAETCGMDRQTLRDRVHRYNAEGLAGLSDRRAPGPAPRLPAAQEAEVDRGVEDGPEPGRDGVVRWRCRDLRERIEGAFGVRFHERTVGKLLARRRFRRLSVRPRHPEGDPAAQDAFRGASPSGRGRRSRRWPPARRSGSGSRTRPGSGSRARRRASGPGGARAPGCRGTSAMPGPTCSARSARSGASAPRW